MLNRVIRYAVERRRLKDMQQQLHEAQLLISGDKNSAAARQGHVFISYVSEDSPTIDGLQQDLERAGIKVWRDRTSLGPGVRWKDEIRCAISSGTYFICCFSGASKVRRRSYMNEELILAIEELRVRDRAQSWFLPVIFPGGEIQDWPIGAGENLSDFNYTLLFPDTWRDGVSKLVKAIQHYRY
jgi:hypothetical protein